MVIGIECNLCGRDVKILQKAEIEGTIVEVCDRCLKFGTKVFETTYKPIGKKIKLEELQGTEVEFVPNYGQIIKQRREIKGLKRIDFAKIINEKESVIKRIEEGQMEPNENLRKKIEKFFGMELTEKYEERVKPVERKKQKLTVGDIAEIK